MHLIPRVILRAQPEVDGTLPLTLTASSVVRRGFLHLLLDPFVVSDLSWIGVSLLVARFNCTLDKNLAIIELPEAPGATNFCLCVAWKTGEGTAKRFKLWANVGEKLYAPLYDGRRIPSTFWLEVWSCADETSATLDGQLSLKTSLVQLGDLTKPCLDADTEELITAQMCHDNTWELREDDNPALSDYWTFTACGDGTFVNVGDPAPPSGPTSPDDGDLSTLIAAWYDAEYLAVTKPDITDGQPVGISYPAYSGWVSKPPTSGYISYQASSSNRPLYKTNIIGAKPGVLFDGSNDQLPMSSSFSPGSWLTLAVVCKRSLSDGGLWGGGTNLAIAVNANKLQFGYLSGSGWTTLDSSVGSTPAGDTKLLVCRFKFSTREVAFRENKIAKGSGVIVPAAGTFNFVSIGAGQVSYAVPTFGGYIFEWILWYAAIADADLDSLYDNYFKPKWSELP